MPRRWDERGNLIEEGEEITARRSWDEDGNLIYDARPSQAEDIIRSGTTGVQRGAAGLAGMPGDISSAQAGAVDWLQERITGRKLKPQTRENLRRTAGALLFPLFGAAGMGPTSTQYNEVIQRVLGRQYTPRTRAGEFARTIGEFLPAAAAPSGSIALRLGRAVIPGAASEAVGGAPGVRGTPYEPLARLAAGVGGGLATEASAIALARQANRLAPAARSVDLERRFGPLTRGERSGNLKQRREEYRWRQGVAPGEGEARIRVFDAMRGRQIRENAMSIPTRGLPALSEDVESAGVILADEMRTAREELRRSASQQYDEAFNLAKNEPVPPSDELTARMGNLETEYGLLLPSGVRKSIDNLTDQMRKGNATQATVERARQALNRELSTASNARDDAAEFAIDKVIGMLDDWRSGLIRSPEAKRAMDEARGIYRDAAQLYAPRTRVELSTGQTGRTDLGGRTIGRLLDTEMTGEQVIDSIIGNLGTRPAQAALGAVDRIVEMGTRRIKYTNRQAASGVRIPGRTSQQRTMAQTQFEADDPSFAGVPQWNMRPGVHQPTAILQSLREGLWHKLLRPLDDYLRSVETQGVQGAGVLPAGTMVRQLENAILKSGRPIMEKLYTKRELSQMRDFLEYMRRLVPPLGAHSPSGPMILNAVTNLLDRLAGIGTLGVWPALREVVQNASTNSAIRSAISPRNLTQRGPSPLFAPLAAQSAGRDREITIDARGEVIQ